MIEFTHTAYSLDNTEVFTILAPRIIEAATSSDKALEAGTGAAVMSLRIVEAADILQQSAKKTNVLAEDREGMEQIH